METTTIMLNSEEEESAESFPGAAGGARNDAVATAGLLLSEQDAATWDGIISEEDDEEDDFEQVVHDNDCFSNSCSQSGILILPRVRSNEQVAAAAAALSPLNLSLPGSVPSHIESIMLNSNNGAGAGDSISGLQSLRQYQLQLQRNNAQQQESKQVVPLRTFWWLALGILVLALTPTLYLVWERNEVRSTALRLEEQLVHLQQQVVVQQQQQGTRSNNSNNNEQFQAQQQQLNQQIQTLQEQIQAKTRQLESRNDKARRLEEQVRNLQQQQQQQQANHDNKKAPSGSPSYRSFAWEKDGSGSSNNNNNDDDNNNNSNSYNKKPKIDTCWVRANADFELGDCAVQTKKSVKKKLHKLRTKLWRAHEDFVDKLHDYKQRYGTQFDGTFSYFDDNGKFAAAASGNSNQNNNNKRTKERLYKIGKTATSVLSGVAFASAAALIVSGSFLGSVIGDPDNNRND